MKNIIDFGDIATWPQLLIDTLNKGPWHFNEYEL